MSEVVDKLWFPGILRENHSNSCLGMTAEWVAHHCANC